MRDLSKFILWGLLISPLFVLAISCSEEADCSMAARVMVQCNLYATDGQTIETYTLDSLTITAQGTDSVILNCQADVTAISLPLRYTADSTVLIFHYNGSLRDTVLIRHTNTPYFLSMDCGYQMKQSISGVGYTCHRLDSIYISYNEAGIDGRENIKLFY